MYKINRSQADKRLLFLILNGEMTNEYYREKQSIYFENQSIYEKN